MLGCLAHAVLLSSLLYAGMSIIRTVSVIQYVPPGYIWGRGTYLMYPLVRVPTVVFVLSTASSRLLPLRGYICLDRIIICSFYLIRGWVVVYLAFSLWTVRWWVIVYLAVSIWTVRKRVVVYLEVSLWTVSRMFPLFSYAELEFLWWQFTMVLKISSQLSGGLFFILAAVVVKL